MKKYKILLFLLVTIFIVVKFQDYAVSEAASNDIDKSEISNELPLDEDSTNDLIENTEASSTNDLNKEETSLIEESSTTSVQKAPFTIKFEEKINLTNSNVLILAADNKFLIKDSSNSNVDINEWDMPDGYFNNKTEIEGSGAFHIKSIAPVEIGKILNSDASGVITIDAGSNITIDNRDYIASNVADLTTWSAAIESKEIILKGSESERIVLGIKAKYIGMFSENIEVNYSDITVESDAYGIYAGDKKDEILTGVGQVQLLSANINVNVKENVLPAVSDCELIDENGELTGKKIKGSTGMLSYSIYSQDSDIIINSDGHGIIYGSALYFSADSAPKKPKITVNVKNGLGIFSQYQDDYQLYQNIGSIQITDTDIRAISENGPVAIASENIYSSITEGKARNEIYAKSKNCFAILAQNLSYMQKFPSGNITFNDTNVEAYTEEGMAISTNYANFTNTDIKAVVDKGIAVSVCMFYSSSSSGEKIKCILSLKAQQKDIFKFTIRLLILQV